MVFLQLLCHFRPFQVIPTKRATSARRATARYSALSTKEKAYTIHTEVVRNCNVNSSRFSLNNLTFGFTSFQLINPKRATARYSALLRATVRYPAKRKHTYCYILKFYCTFLMVFLQLLCHFRPFQVIPTKRATSALQRATRYSALQRATARYPPKRKHIQYILKL